MIFEGQLLLNEIDAYLGTYISGYIYYSTQLHIIPMHDDITGNLSPTIETGYDSIYCITVEHPWI